MDTPDTKAPNPVQQEHIALAFDPMQIIDIFMKRFKMIVAFVFLFAILGATYVSLQTPYYTASALVQLNTQERALVEGQVAAITDDEAAVNSELDILRSPELTARVIHVLSLFEKEEFNPVAAPQTVFDRVMQAWRQQNPQEESAEMMRTRIIHAVRDRLALKKDPMSNTVRVSFTSKRGERAKNIANAYAQEYLRFQIEANERENRAANAWLSERVEDLRREVIASDNAVERYKAENTLFQMNGMTLDDRQLSELSSQLIEARGEVSQTQARLAQAEKVFKSGKAAAVPEVLNAILIQKLREQEAELLRERSELSAQFGPKHPKMTGITSEISNLRGKIKSEIGKIVEGLKNEVIVAEAKVENLKNELEFARSRASSSAEKDVELRELERAAAVNKTLYESFLTRLKETGEAANLQQSNAKIIAAAQLPLYPTKPNKKLILAFFIAFGACLAGLLVLLLEYFSQGFSSAAQVEEQLGVTMIGLVPEFKAGRDAHTLADLALQNSGSIYTEALKRVLASLQFSDDADAPARSIMMTSSLPQEGKGWLAAALARVMAQSGKRVLLIDCDLRRRSITDLFAVDNDAPTMNDYLSGDAEIGEIILNDAQSGLDVIGSRPTKGHVQVLLESEKIKALMDHAHFEYDMVFVDAPPVIGLSDTLFLAQLIDKTVLIIQAEKTPCNVVMNALQILERAHVTVAGAMLSRVGLEDYKKHEFGNRSFQQKYSDYYQDLRNSDGIAGKILKFRRRA